MQEENKEEKNSSVMKIIAEKLLLKKLGAIKSIQKTHEGTRIEWEIPQFKPQISYRSPPFELLSSKWFLRVNPSLTLPPAHSSTLFMRLEKETQKQYLIDYHLGIHNDVSHLSAASGKRQFLFTEESILTPEEPLIYDEKLWSVGGSVTLFCVIHLRTIPSLNVSSPTACSTAFTETEKTEKNETNSINVNSSTPQEVESAHFKTRKDAIFSDESAAFKSPSAGVAVRSADAGPLLLARLSNDRIERNSNLNKITKGNRGRVALSRHLKDLYQGKCFKDITITVKTREFFAHKGILSARSSVFASIFEQDTFQKKNVMEISDCDPDTFQEFLLFLYTGDFCNVSCRNATDLYELSNKYNVKDLKEKCIWFMRTYLTPAWFSDIFRLATMHRETDLLEAATEFFVTNAPLILITVKWQNFIVENPLLGNELFVKFANKVVRNADD